MSRVAVAAFSRASFVPRVAVIGVVGLAWPLGAPGQWPDVSGYYLHAAAGMERSLLTESGIMDFQRIRLMTRPTWASLEIDIAYEQTLTLRSDDVALGRGFEGIQEAGPWLDLQGTLVDRQRVTWAHSLDRLSLSRRMGDRARVTVGRQTISWATALYFTPTDPFVPFDPADPFREYRGGVDAARAVWFLGPFSELDAVVRPAPDVNGGETLTALLRGQHMLRGWEVSGWTGVLHDEPAIALAAVGSAGAFGLRFEGGVRREEGDAVTSVALGTDRLFEVFDRDLRAVLEYQHVGLGAKRADELIGTAQSAPARRGELSVLGRDALVLSGTYQVHPLTSVDLLTLVNARDGSTLLAPGVVHSLGNEVSLRMGAFMGLGPGADEGALRSEHGETPMIGYAAVSVFF